MEIAFKSSVWALTFGGLGYALLKFVKPDDELIAKYKQETRHTFASKQAQECADVLKAAADQNSELNKKINELLKK